MIKARLKRIKHGACFNPYNLDKHFVNGSVAEMPKKGERVIFYFKNLDQGWLKTTAVVSIIRTWKGMIIFNTKNSRYHLKKGWTK